MAAKRNAKDGGEYALRDDDRETPYAGSGRRARSSYLPIFILGLLVVAAFLVYGLYHRGEVPSQGKPEATVGSTR
jgi:hypothetical protein